MGYTYNISWSNNNQNQQNQNNNLVSFWCALSDSHSDTL